MIFRCESRSEVPVSVSVSREDGSTEESDPGPENRLHLARSLLWNISGTVGCLRTKTVHCICSSMYVISKCIEVCEGFHTSV